MAVVKTCIDVVAQRMIIRTNINEKHTVRRIIEDALMGRNISFVSFAAGAVVAVVAVAAVAGVTISFKEYLYGAARILITKTNPEIIAPTNIVITVFVNVFDK